MSVDFLFAECNVAFRIGAINFSIEPSDKPTGLSFSTLRLIKGKNDLKWVIFINYWTDKCV